MEQFRFGVKVRHRDPDENRRLGRGTVLGFVDWPDGVPRVVVLWAKQTKRGVQNRLMFERPENLRVDEKRETHAEAHPNRPL
jgi:hypothetical protein